MLSKKKLDTIKYLKSEYDRLKDDPNLMNLGCLLGLVNNDIFHWKFSLIGPQNTPYGEGIFFLTADFPEDYPQGRPEVRFCNKIYHLNVSQSNGHIGISILNNWTPKTPMIDIISGIYVLFYEQNPLSCYSGNMAREYENNRNEFDRKAKEWTKKYASLN